MGAPATAGGGPSTFCETLPRGRPRAARPAPAVRRSRGHRGAGLPIPRRGAPGGVLEPAARRSGRGPRAPRPLPGGDAARRLSPRRRARGRRLLRRRLLRHLSPRSRADGPPAPRPARGRLARARGRGAVQGGAARLADRRLRGRVPARLRPTQLRGRHGARRLRRLGHPPQHRRQSAVVPARSARAQPGRRHGLLVVARGDPPRLP